MFNQTLEMKLEKKQKISTKLQQIGNSAIFAAIAAIGFPLAAGSQPERSLNGAQSQQPLYGAVYPVENPVEEEKTNYISIVGNALDSTNGTPIPQVMVQLYADKKPLWLTVTDENGYFQIDYRGLVEKNKVYRIKLTPLNEKFKTQYKPAETTLKDNGTRVEFIKDTLTFKLQPQRSKKRK